MSKNGTGAITGCVVIWLFATVLLIPGTMDADTMTVIEGIKSFCYITLGLGIVSLIITIIDRGDDKTLTNIDKAINCLKMDKLDGHKDIEQLNQAMRYIMRERAERHAKEKEARRLAERKASSN